jgi:Alpha/beta hydrolase domain
MVNRHTATMFRLYMALLAPLLIVTACSDSNNNSSSPTATKPQAVNPLVEGPVIGGGGDDCCKVVIGNIEIDVSNLLNYTPGTPFYAGLYFDESELGYRETEYFISGTATSYIATDELGEDGIWSVQPADSAAFKTRIVVLRPENAADFNGTVVVEWFNVSGGTDASPDLVQMHTELMREGYAWVGVSAQSVGVEGGDGAGYDVSLKVIDAERYGSLNHPGDSFSYDIYSQAAQAVRHPMGPDPLDGLQVEYMIGVGESQSAWRMATYVNAIHPTVELFDGFLIHSRGNRSAALSQDPQVAVTSPGRTLIRADFPQPVLGVETETDIFGLGSSAEPQPDAENFRLWEVAGNAHYDAYGVVKGPVDRGNDPGVAQIIETRSGDSAGIIQCQLPINDGPGHWVLKAAIASLDHWIRTGEPAASAQPIARNATNTDLQRDRYGNAIGGVRTPHVDAPVAVLSGQGQSGTSFCFLFGTTALFDEATLSQLYPTREAYIDAIDTTTDRAVERGFVLPADAELIKAQARRSE